MFKSHRAFGICDDVRILWKNKDLEGGKMCKGMCKGMFYLSFNGFRFILLLRK